MAAAEFECMRSRRRRVLPSHARPGTRYGRAAWEPAPYGFARRTACRRMHPPQTLHSSTVRPAPAPYASLRWRAVRQGAVSVVCQQGGQPADPVERLTYSAAPFAPCTRVRKDQEAMTVHSGEQRTVREGES